MACSGSEATIAQQLKSAINAGFSYEQAVTIVSISQAESGGNIYCTGPNTQWGNPYGNLQFLPMNQNLAGCNLKDSNPQNALDCNYKTAYALWKQQGFCAWATYDNGHCPGSGGPDRNTAYKGFTQQVYNTLISLTQSGNDPIQVIGSAASGTASGIGNAASGAASGTGQLAGGAASGVGQVAQNVAGTVAEHIPSAPGWDALKGLAGGIADFFKDPKAGMARIVLFILGIFIAFEAVKHLSGGSSNLVVVGAQNTGNAAKNFLMTNPQQKVASKGGVVGEAAEGAEVA